MPLTDAKAQPNSQLKRTHIVSKGTLTQAASGTDPKTLSPGDKQETTNSTETTSATKLENSQATVHLVPGSIYAPAIDVEAKVVEDGVSDTSTDGASAASGSSSSSSDSDNEGSKKIVPLYKVDCLKCGHLVAFATHLYRKCHIDQGNERCPAGQMTIKVHIPLERPAMSLAKAHVNRNSEKYAEGFNKLIGYVRTGQLSEEEFQKVKELEGIYIKQLLDAKSSEPSHEETKSSRKKDKRSHRS